MPSTPSHLTACAKCGEPHARCSAHRKYDGKPCTQRKMKGQGVCKTHGGMAKQNRVAGARRVAEEAAVKAVALFGARRDVHPADALIELVQWTAGEVEYWRERVRVLAAEDERALTWGKTKVVDKGSGEAPGVDETEEAGPSVAYRMLTSAQDRLASYCVAALKAGVEERRVQLAEAQGQQVAGAIRAILAELGLTTDQQARVPDVVPRHLRLLAGP